MTSRKDLQYWSIVLEIVDQYICLGFFFTSLSLYLFLFLFLFFFLFVIMDVDNYTLFEPMVFIKTKRVITTMEYSLYKKKRKENRYQDPYLLV